MVAQSAIALSGLVDVLYLRQRASSCLPLVQVSNLTVGPLVVLCLEAEPLSDGRLQLTNLASLQGQRGERPPPSCQRGMAKPASARKMSFFPCAQREGRVQCLSRLACPSTNGNGVDRRDPLVPGFRTQRSERHNFPFLRLGFYLLLKSAYFPKEILYFLIASCIECIISRQL